MIEWIKIIYDEKDKGFPFILIGNKNDSKHQREVSEEEGLEAAEIYETIYFETNAKEGINVEESFDELLNKIINSKKFKEKREKRLDNIRLNVQKKEKLKIEENIK